MAVWKGVKKPRRQIVIAPLLPEKQLKLAKFMGSSKKDLSKMPVDVRSVFGHALFEAQQGDVHVDAKPMAGFGGAAQVMEIVANSAGATYRAMYTVKIGDYLFVLHCFKKKSTSGVATPQPDIELIKQRLSDAKKLHKQLTHGATK